MRRIYPLPVFAHAPNGQNIVHARVPPIRPAGEAAAADAQENQDLENQPGPAPAAEEPVDLRIEYGFTEATVEYDLRSDWHSPREECEALRDYKFRLRLQHVPDRHISEFTLECAVPNSAEEGAASASRTIAVDWSCKSSAQELMGGSLSKLVIDPDCSSHQLGHLQTRLASENNHIAQRLRMRLRTFEDQMRAYQRRRDEQARERRRGGGDVPLDRIVAEVAAEEQVYPPRQAMYPPMPRAEPDPNRNNNALPRIDNDAPAADREIERRRQLRADEVDFNFNRLRYVQAQIDQYRRELQVQQRNSRAMTLRFAADPAAVPPIGAHGMAYVEVEIRTLVFTVSIRHVSDVPAEQEPVIRSQRLVSLLEHARDGVLEGVDASVHQPGEMLLLVSEQGDAFACHRLIARQIPAWASSMDGASNYVEASNGSIQVNFSSDTLRALVTWLYTGRVENEDPGIVAELLSAANMYLLDDLKVVITQMASRLVTPDTCVHFLLVADVCRVESLKRSCLRQIAQNCSFGQLVGSADFAGLQENKDLLAEVFEYLRDFDGETPTKRQRRSLQ